MTCGLASSARRGGPGAIPGASPWWPCRNRSPFSDCARPPTAGAPEKARPHFRRLRMLAAEAQALKIPGVTMRELSMGMSGDFEVAVEEGATLVRIGTALFGPRPVG